MRRFNSVRKPFSAQFVLVVISANAESKKPDYAVVVSKKSLDDADWNAVVKALVKKHSYVGESTVFGKKYDAHYAPLTGDDGALTGALFVGVPK